MVDHTAGQGPEKRLLNCKKSSKTKDRQSSGIALDWRSFAFTSLFLWAHSRRRNKMHHI